VGEPGVEGGGWSAMPAVAPSRLRERGLPQWDSPNEERALTRAFGATSPASGRGDTRIPWMNRAAACGVGRIKVIAALGTRRGVEPWTCPRARAILTLS